MERHNTLRFAGGAALAAVFLGVALVSTSGAGMARADTATSTPVISGITASTTDTGATVAWTTDVAANSQILYGTTTSYGSSTTLQSALTTSHSQTLGGLTPGTLYHFQIQSANASGTLATSTDQTLTTATTTASSSPAAVISGILASPTQTGATITWTTDIAANSQILYGTTTSYGSSTTLNSAFSTSHSQTLSGLLPGTLYHFQIQGTNASGTLATSTDQTLTTATTTASSSPAAVISGILASPTQTGATITWTTDVGATSQVLYGTNAFYGASTTLQSALTTSHSQTLGGLAPGTLYHFQIQSANASGTLATSTDQTFTTSGTTTAPTLSGVAVTPTQTGATITWTSDQPASTQIQYGQTTSYGSSTTLQSALTTSHSQTLSGLLPSTLYHFTLGGSNGSGVAIAAFDRTFTTLAATTTPGTGGTGTTTQDQIDQLRNRVGLLEQMLNALQQQFNSLQQQFNALGNGGGGNGTTTPATSNATANPISPVPPGGTIDLGGRNFGHEEPVQITLGGTLFATGHADGGGNFTTGSLKAPSTPGTYTFTFTGMQSGIVRTATLTVTP